VQLYAGAFLPGFMLAGSISVTSSCSRGGNLTSCLRSLQASRRVDLPPFAQTLARHGSNALMGLWRGLTEAARRREAHCARAIFVTLVPGAVHCRIAGHYLPDGDSTGGRGQHGRLIEAGAGSGA